jgi:hypothetical protein
LYLLKPTEKHPSPLANPDIHCGWGINWFSTRGLSTGVVLGKADFNTSDNPKFKPTFKFTISCNPSIVRCLFCCINITTFLNIK